MARSKSNPSSSISHFWLSAPSPTSRLRTQRFNITTTSSARPHHLPPLISTPISNSALEIDPQWLDFAILAFGPFSRLVFANATPHHHHHLMRATTPPPPTDIHSH